MGTIMRGDQTLRLIQLYYNNYPEIARNTQDADGRRMRSQMWQRITDELNAAYDTNFSVEQYKKKIQNVQCTSRQKIQTGKRNLGVAEFEYLRLFEQERLTCNGFNMDAYDSLTRSSSADLSANLKVEQMLEQFGISVVEPGLQLQQAAAGEQGGVEHSSNSDSDSNTTTTVPSTVPDGQPHTPPPGLFDPRHLIFALGQLGQMQQENNRNPVHNGGLPVPKSVESAEERDVLKRAAVPDEVEVNRILAAKKRRLNGLFGPEDKWKKDMAEKQQHLLDVQHKICDQLQVLLAQQTQWQAVGVLGQKLDQLCAVLGDISQSLRCRQPKTELEQQRPALEAQEERAGTPVTEPAETPVTEQHSTEPQLN